MRKIVASVSVIFLLMAASHSALAKGASSYASANNGVGIAVGDPGGITFFHKLDERNFIQAFLSQNLLIGADYASAFPNAITAIPELTPFVGGGAFFFKFSHSYYGRYDRYGYYKSGDEFGIGGRIPLGLLLQVPNAPVQFHVEISPSILVIPALYSFLDAMIGVRFLF